MVNQNGQCQEKCKEGYENKGGTCECAASFKRLDNFNNMGSICCASGMVNQNGQCQEKCNEGYENKNNICVCDSNSNNINGVCCSSGSVVQDNECRKQCRNNAVATNGICPSKLLYDKQGITCLLAPI